MTWSPLAGGFLTGKYEDGVPLYSRASMKVLSMFSFDFLFPAVFCNYFVVKSSDSEFKVSESWSRSHSPFVSSSMLLNKTVQHW